MAEEGLIDDHDHQEEKVIDDHQEEEVIDDHDHHVEQIKAGKKFSEQKLTRSDSLKLDLESHIFTSHHAQTPKGAEWSVILLLAFLSIGIVYGDIGTSPLYVYSSTFTNGIKDKDDILGVLSLILYTLTLIPFIKYVFIVLQANDNGNGGTFALYSLICRYAKLSLIPSQQEEDYHVSSNKRQRSASRLKSTLENSEFAKIFLLLATMLGTSMVIGDGVLAPSMSVLSAVGGIKQAKFAMTEDAVVWISVAILVCLFMIQRFGTDKVGYTSAPILCVWFVLIGWIGFYNFVKYDPTVLKALNPQYIVDYFRRNRKEAWISLGGVVLSTTGAEALFADVGHFTVRSIQISMCSVTYPALILTYTGQASFLRKHTHLVADAFYSSVPKTLYWPMLGVAILASIIASQSMISGTFSIIQQSLSLGCFPRVKIVHTSSKYAGQVYIPEINYLLMLASVGVTLGFRSTATIGNAYGIAVVFVMSLTSSFLVLIMIMIWKTNILLIISYVVIIGSVELMYLSSVLYKFDQGGYLPLLFATVLMIMMFVWNDVHRRKYYYELDQKISPEKLKFFAAETKIVRMPGLAMFYSELVHGIPPIFNHYMKNVPALHSVLVFVSIKSLPISTVSLEERFIFCRVEPKELNMFGCVARYGYTNVCNEEEPFEELLVAKLKEFIRDDLRLSQRSGHSNGGETTSDDHVLVDAENEDHGGIKQVDEDHHQQQEEVLLEREIEAIDKAWNSGVVHLIGENEVVAAKGAGIVKRILIDYAYNFMKRNLRQSDKVFDIPHKRMLKVGMTYQL